MKISLLLSAFLLTGSALFSDSAEDATSPFILDSEENCTDRAEIAFLEDREVCGLTPIPIYECCIDPMEITPWFTDSLLTPRSWVIPYGCLNVKPYLFVKVKNAEYDSDWHAVKVSRFSSVTSQVPVEVGLTRWMSILVNLQASCNNTRGATSLVFNDLTTSLNFQICRMRESESPDIKFYLQEIFPTGRYQRLKRKQHHTDSGGGGCFVTGLGFVVGDIHQVDCESYFYWRINPFYNFQASRKVQGINTYGGAPNTKGTIHFGQSWGLLIGLEYSFNQNCVISLDVENLWFDKVRFSGQVGNNRHGTPASVGRSSAAQFTIAPALEYNWSESMGIVMGPWFAVGGRNSSRFISGVVAFNYYASIRKASFRDCM